jgi:hypothetical protein
VQVKRLLEAVEFVAEDLAGNRVEEAVDDRAPVERLGSVKASTKVSSS